jgi:hypothetical protein
MKDKLGCYHTEDGTSPSEEYLTYECLLQRLIETMHQWDEESVAKIANKILTEKVIYDSKSDRFILKRKDDIQSKT